MSSLLHPVGPEPPAVYWRRRAVVVGGLILVLVVLVMIIKACAGGGGGDQPKASPSVKAADSLPSAEAPAAPATAECTAAEIEVISRNSGPFTPGQPIVVGAEITNNGSRACSVVPSAQNVQLHVISGSDKIFETSHCADQAPLPGPEATLTIQPGETEILQIPWDGMYSADRCGPGSGPAKRGREAWYEATVTVNGALSDKTSFILKD
ncbi:MAG: hypothetical protein FWG16_05290 [Micrococcales bacterium]|nr:hypothetical protein [Micrococcales bacterium]